MPTFDTLTYAQKLREVGFTEQQATAQAEALLAVVDANLATKHDIEQLRREIKEIEANLSRDIKEVETGLRREIKEIEANLSREIKEVETGLRREIKELETGLRRDLKELETASQHNLHTLESRLTLKLGGLIIAGVSGLAVLMKLL